MARNSGKPHTKKSVPNPYHRNLNTVRTKPRRPFGSGPVVKNTTFGRCKPLNKWQSLRGLAHGGRYT